MIDAHPRSSLNVLHSSTEEICPRSTLRKPPCLMTAVAPEHQPSPGRKRRRGAIEEEQSTTAATSPQPPWKRTKRPFKSRQEATTAYWDSLSKLWLTRRALRELNRRNGRTVCPARTAPGSQLDSSTDRAALEDCSDQIKRFARHGGPDLRDLIGVRLARVTSRPSLILSLQNPEPVAANSTPHAMQSSQSTSRTQSKSRNTLDDSTAKTSTSKTKKSSPYDPNFEQNLIDHGTYPNRYRHPDGRRPPKPDNWNEINQRMTQPRPSLSPSHFSDGAFDDFVQTNEEALTEAIVMRKVLMIYNPGLETGNSYIRP